MKQRGIERREEGVRERERGRRQDKRERKVINEQKENSYNYNNLIQRASQ